MDFRGTDGWVINRGEIARALFAPEVYVVWYVVPNSKILVKNVWNVVERYFELWGIQLSMRAGVSYVGAHL